MKDLLDKILKPKKVKPKEVEEVIEAPYKVEAPETIKKPNHFPDCTCSKCLRWNQQNAK
jgi:hypothetical protein